MDLYQLTYLLGICAVDFISTLCFVYYTKLYYLLFILFLCYIFYDIYDKYGTRAIIYFITAIMLIIVYVSYQPILALTMDVSKYLPIMILSMCLTQILSGFILSYISLNMAGLVCVIFGILLRLFINKSFNLSLLSVLLGVFSSFYMLLTGKILLNEFEKDQPILFGYALFIALKCMPIFKSIVQINIPVSYLVHIILGLGIFLFYSNKNSHIENQSEVIEDRKTTSIYDILSGKLLLLGLYGSFISSFFYLMNITTIKVLIKESPLLSNSYMPIFEQASSMGNFLVPLLGDMFGVLRAQIYCSYINSFTITMVLLFCTNIFTGNVFTIFALVSLWLAGFMYAPHMLPQIYAAVNEDPESVSIYCAILNVIAMIIGNFGVKILERMITPYISMKTMLLIFLVISIIPNILSYIIYYQYSEKTPQNK